VTVTIALGASAVGASAQAAGPGGATQATEVGITSSTIRIGVIADDNDALAPGLFAGSPRAVTAYAKLINATGGLAGRKLQVDFLDSQLSDTATANAVIKACSQDFAIVGTEAEFMQDVSKPRRLPRQDGRGNWAARYRGILRKLRRGLLAGHVQPEPSADRLRHLEPASPNLPG